MGTGTSIVLILLLALTIQKGDAQELLNFPSVDAVGVHIGPVRTTSTTQSTSTSSTTSSTVPSTSESSTSTSTSTSTTSTPTTSSTTSSTVPSTSESSTSTSTSTSTTSTPTTSSTTSSTVPSTSESSTSTSTSTSTSATSTPTSSSTSTSTSTTSTPTSTSTSTSTTSTSSSTSSSTSASTPTSTPESSPTSTSTTSSSTSVSTTPSTPETSTSTSTTESSTSSSTSTSAMSTSTSGTSAASSARTSESPSASPSMLLETSSIRPGTEIPSTASSGPPQGSTELSGTTMAHSESTSTSGLATSALHASTVAVSESSRMETSSTMSLAPVSESAQTEIRSSTAMSSELTSSMVHATTPITAGSTSSIGRVTTPMSSESTSSIGHITTPMSSESTSSVGHVTTPQLNAITAATSESPLPGLHTTLAHSESTSIHTELHMTTVAIKSTTSEGHTTSEAPRTSEKTATTPVASESTRLATAEVKTTFAFGPGGPKASGVKLSDYDCSGVEAGQLYGNPKVPCDTKYFICVDRSMFAYERPCPAKLYFDPETKNCDMWAHIPACTGGTRPPMVQVNETEFTLSPVPPIIDCYNATDGSNHADPESKPKQYCSNRYFICAGRREFRRNCPRSLYYDLERNQCDLYDRVFACSGNRVPANETDESFFTVGPTLPPVNFDCSGKSNGYYIEKCDSIYYSCTDGQARELRCPDGLVFDTEWLACEAPYNTLICTGTRRPTTVRPSTVSHKVEITSPYPLNCRGQPNINYRDPEQNCSRLFYSCSNDITYQKYCPGNLYYDAEFDRCDLWINVFACSGIRPTSTMTPSRTTPVKLPTVDFDCSHRENGDYQNPNNSCSHFFYQCANMEAYQQWCPAGLYYSPTIDSCDSWANIFECSGITHKPTVSTSPRTPGTTQKPEFDCSELQDGIYFKDSNCSNVYFQCSGGYTFKFTCPGGLFYDVGIGQCDVREYVFDCSGLTRPPSTPSRSTPSTQSTPRPPIDCRTLPDDDYPDPTAKNQCSHYFYSCSGGRATRRECADGAYFDPEVKRCDVYWNIPACTGKPRPITIRTTMKPKVTGTPSPFNCTRLNDGSYPTAKCSINFYSCVGGTTFPRRCPMDQVWDNEFGRCEFPFLLPECGGQRVTSAPIVNTPSPTPVGGFSCEFKQDGPYIDPAGKNGCSTFYYTCSNGITTRTHCPRGLYYDVRADNCNSRELVLACNGGVTAAIQTTKLTSPTAHAETSTRPTVGTTTEKSAPETTSAHLTTEKKTESTAVPTTEKKTTVRMTTTAPETTAPHLTTEKRIESTAARTTAQVPITTPSKETTIATTETHKITEALTSTSIKPTVGSLDVPTTAVKETPSTSTTRSGFWVWVTATEGNHDASTPA